MFSVAVNELGTRAIESWCGKRDRLEPAHGTLELVGAPHIVLITKGEVVGFDGAIFCQRHEVGAYSAFRPLMQGNSLRTGFREFANDVRGTIG